MNQSGANLDVPSRQYFQLEIKAVSDDIWEMARIDSIAIEYFPLLAPILVTTQWNGRAKGAMVDPGIYLAQVSAKTRRGDFKITRPFSLAY